MGKLTSEELDRLSAIAQDPGVPKDERWRAATTAVMDISAELLARLADQ